MHSTRRRRLLRPARVRQRSLPVGLRSVDNVDGYTNNPGFALNGVTQLPYNLGTCPARLAGFSTSSST